MWLTNSSVGRKVVMSVTGLALILFLTFHVLMNAVAIFSPEAYNKVCGILGANWYAISATLVLAALFVIHIIYAFWLTLQNKKARGNNREHGVARPKSVEWASQNMLALGVVIACFTVLHLYQFWGRMMLAEILPCCANEVSPANGWGQIMLQFGGALGWGVLVVYLIGFGALWFHMTHGFWSAFQSLGTNNTAWLPRLKKTACAWATIVCLLFAVEAVVFTLKAQCPECSAQKVPAYELKIMEKACHGHHGDCTEAPACHKGGCPEAAAGECCKGGECKGGECAGKCEDKCNGKCESGCPEAAAECCKGEGHPCCEELKADCPKAAAGECCNEKVAQ